MWVFRRNVVSPLFSLEVRRSQDPLKKQRAKDAGASEGHLVMRWIGIQTLSHVKTGANAAFETSSRSFVTREFDKPSTEEKQMTVMRRIATKVDLSATQTEAAIS